MATILPNTQSTAPTPNLFGSAGALTPAQVAQNAAITTAGSQVAGPGNNFSTTNPAPGSTVAAIAGTTNSAAGSPASSATGQQNVAGQNAINGVTNPPPVVPKTTQADFYNAVNSYTGTTIDNSVIAQGMAAGMTEDEATQIMNTQIQNNIAQQQALTDKNQQLADQQASDLADTAENDAELATAKAQVDQQMAGLNQSETNKAAAAGGSDTVAGTNQSGVAAYVSGVKSYAYTQLQNLANQKQAAINSGNTKAIASINDSYNKVVADLQTKLSSDITQEAQKAGDVKQQQAVLDANTQAKATSQYNTSLSNLTSASPLSSLFDSSGQPVAGALTNPAFTNSSTYQQGIAAGLTPQAILSDTQNAVKTSKAAAKQDSLNTELMRAQIEEANSATAANTKVLNQTITSSISGATGTTGKDGSTIDGNAYNDAVSSIATAGKLTIAQTNAIGGAIATALNSGNTTQSKNLVTQAVFSVIPTQDKTTIAGLNTVASVIPGIQATIASLPQNEQSGIINGNIQDLSAKLGQNPDPKLQQLGAELGHLKALYMANVFGKRAVLSNNSMFNSLMPDIKDGSSLMYSDLAGLSNTANAFQQGTIQSVIGNDTYNSIFNGNSTPSITVSNGVDLSKFMK